MGAHEIVLASHYEDLANRDDIDPLIGIRGVAGHADGRNDEALFNNPTGLARSRIYPGFDLASQRKLYIADTGNDAIRRLSPDGMLVTIAGLPGHSGHADGPGSSARFAGPVGIELASNGTLGVADTSNNVIRRLSTSAPRLRPVGLRPDP